MKPSRYFPMPQQLRWIPLTFVLIQMGCTIYNDSLLEQAQGSETGTGGDGGDGDGMGTGGGPAFLAESTSGGSAASLHTGGSGAGTGGEGGKSFEVSSGGAPSEGETGGDASAGGTAAGGSATGGSATGGSEVVDAATGGGPMMEGGSGGGSGQATPPCEPPADVILDLVDDMALAGNRILVQNDRSGDWQSFHGSDLDTQPSPNEIGRWLASPMSERLDDPGNYALNYVSSLNTTTPDPGEVWQHFGFHLAEGEAYDLSPYDGVLFCARRSLAGILSLNMRVSSLVSGQQEATFETSGGIIPAEWMIVKFPFGADWPLEALTSAKVLEFVASPGVEYDIWMDDISFYSEK